VLSAAYALRADRVSGALLRIESNGPFLLPRAARFPLTTAACTTPAAWRVASGCAIVPRCV
jgi:hypothetical protein